MHFSVPVSLVATASLFSAVQGAISILSPASGSTVDASKGIDVVWTYDSTDFTNWEIELANPTPGKVIATNVVVSSVSATGTTATGVYHVPAFTDSPNGNNYRIVLDPRNGGTGVFPESGEFTLVNGGGTSSGTTSSATSATTLTSSSATSSSSSSSSSSSGSSSVVSTASNSKTTSTTTGSVSPSSAVTSSHGRNSTVVSTSTQFSTFVSGSVTSLIPESTVFETTVVGGAGPTGSSTSGSPTSSPTVALAAAGSVTNSMGVVGGVVGAVLAALML